MTTGSVSDYSEENDIVLQALREAVAEELERKRRLGHYYVIWENGKIVFVGDDAPTLEGSQDE